MIQVPQIHLPVDATLQNGKYQIISVLGQGGFGITYLAKHKVFGEVALKELFLNSGSALCSRENTTQRHVIPHFKSAQFEIFKQRFLEEAKTLYNLRGVKGVVNVQDIFEENGTVYFSMEYLNGTRLSDYVKARTRIPEPEGLEIVKSLARSLMAIHDKNVLHRDIKPDNIIISENGEVHLIDFGIAKSYLEEVDETHTTFHSPRYSPPEQKIARSRMGTFSDIYSLGATAYYLFTGHLPQSFEERLLEVEVYKSPRYHVPVLSEKTNDTIVKSLTLKDKDRIQTAQEFLEALPDISGSKFIKEDIQLISTVKNSKISEGKTEIASDNIFTKTITKDEKTVIDPSSDKTKIVSAPPQKRLENIRHSNSEELVDERTIIARKHSQLEVDPDRTVIYQQTLLEEKQDWKFWLLANKKMIERIGLGLFISLIFIIGWQMIPAPVPLLETTLTTKSEPIILRRLLSFHVKDSESQEVLKAITAIGGNEEVLKINDQNSFVLDVTKEWNRYKSQIITVSHFGYVQQEIYLKDLVNKDTILILEPIKDNNNLVAYPKQLCKNIKGSWIDLNGEKLLLRACLTEEGINNPGGNAVFNGNGATWSSFKEKEEVYLRITLFDDLGETLDFKVIEPYQKRKTRLELKKKNGKIKFKRGKKPTKKTYNLTGQIYDQNGFTLSEAKVYIPNSNYNMNAMNQGRFYFDLTKEWRTISNKKLIIEQDGFYPKELNLKEIINKENYIVRLKPMSIVTPIKTKQEIPNSVSTQFCDKLNGYWMHESSGDVLRIDGCSGSVPRGGVVYNGRIGNWSTGFNVEKDVILNLSFNGAKSISLISEHPRLPANPVLISGSKKFKKSNIEYIFTKNMIGEYSDTKGKNKIKIENITGNRGVVVYNGNRGTFTRSSVTGNGDKTTLIVEIKGKKYVFNVQNITDKKNTFVLLHKKNEEDLAVDKRTKLKRIN